MEALTKRLTESHRQRALLDRQVVLIVAHIVHIEDGRDQKADRDARDEGWPGPARNLHVVCAPGHQEAHRQVNQNITKSTGSELERLPAIEVGDSHTGQSKQQDHRTDAKNQYQA